MAVTTIPIRNLYFLLCYAWQRMEEAEEIDVERIESDSLFDLLAYVLSRSVERLMKQGFYRDYVNHTEEDSIVRGKFDLAASLKRNVLQKGKAVCRTDDFTYDVTHNQIIKATLRRLCATESLNEELRSGIRSLLRRFHRISDIRLSQRLFETVAIHRNNLYYDFLLKICRVVYDNHAILDSCDKGEFPDFVRDEKKLQRLFESFVFNFYKRHTNFQVSSEKLEWRGRAKSDEAKQFLPSMRTDISLKSKNQQIIIDTKFYKNPFTLTRESRTEKLYPSNLYQLFSYLKNPKEGDECENRRGFLLFPDVGRTLNLEYELSGHDVGAYSVDLFQDWRSINDRLLSLV